MYEAEHYIYIERGERGGVVWWRVVKGWLRHFYKDSDIIVYIELNCSSTATIHPFQ